jgi:EpsI family protein
MRLGARAAIVSALLVLAAGYVLLNPPRRMGLAAGALAALPKEIGVWSGADLGFEDVVYDELAADDTLVRRYTRDDGASVWFLIIFHENERYGAHDPLVCYRSQGWEILDQGLTRLAMSEREFDANWILVEKGTEKRLAVFWWYTAGNLATADRDEFLKRMAASGILSNVTFGAFVRASAVVKDNDVDGAMEVLTDFSDAALGYLPGLFVEPGK